MIDIKNSPETLIGLKVLINAYIRLHPYDVMKRSLRRLFLFAVLLAIVSTSIFVVSGLFNIEQDEFIPGEVKIDTAERVKMTLYTEPPKLTEEQIARAEEFMDEPRIYPELAVVAKPNPPEPGTETTVIEFNSSLVEGKMESIEQAPTPFILARNVTSLPSGYTSNVNEPSLGNRGETVFYTGNWYAAVSFDGGRTWNFINPYQDMPDFCCDQDTIYDPTRDIFIWYRQGVHNATGENRFMLGVSRDGINWCMWSIPSTKWVWGRGSWFDYPHIALSNNYLWIATNMFDVNDHWVRCVLMRMGLDDLADCGGLSIGYVYSTIHSSFTPVQGARDVMYFGAHHSNSEIRIYKWPEFQDGTGYTITIDPWKPTYRGDAHCPAPDGGDACQRFDHRILSGWIAKGWGEERVIGFFWNVGEGDGFPYPYVNSAIFRESDLTYLGRPYIWNSSFALIYAAASPNSNGDLGISLFLAGGGYYPASIIGIYDEKTGRTPPGWELYAVRWGTNGPEDNKWGDYVRTRQYSGRGMSWIASSYTLQGCGSRRCVQPQYIIFSRPMNLTDFPKPFVGGKYMHTAFVIGDTFSHGCFGFGARTIDVLGAVGISARLGLDAEEGMPEQAIDSEFTSCSSLTINWTRIASPTVISIGGPGVNMLTYGFNGSSPFVWIYRPGEISALYSMQTGKTYGSQWGVYDHAVIQLTIDGETGKHVLVAWGLSGYGSQAASMVLAHYDRFQDILKGRAVIIRWDDSNGNRRVDLEDQITLKETWQ